jgi:Putative restriction endonuclease
MSHTAWNDRDDAALPDDGRRYAIHDGALSATDRLALPSQRGLEGAPTLAVEILSPSTRTIDRVAKLQLYAPSFPSRSGRERASQYTKGVGSGGRPNGRPPRIVRYGTSLRWPVRVFLRVSTNSTGPSTTSMIARSAGAPT